jgi:O-antigen ligase
MKNIWVNQLINYILVLFAFLLPLSTPMTNIAVILLIVLWIIEGHWRKKYTILKGSLPFLFFLGFILLMGLSLFWSHGIHGGFLHKAHNAINFYFRYYVFGFMIMPIILTSVKKEYIQYIVSAFLLAMLLSELMSWGIFMGWIHYKSIPSYDPSPFMHHTLYSIFLAVTIFVLVTQFFQTKTIRYKVFMFMFAMSALVNLFLNGGRLGQLAFFIALLVYIGLRYKVTLKSMVLSLGLICILFATAYMMSPIFQKRMDLSVQSLQKIMHGNYNSSWGIRTNILIVTKEIIKENPLFGIGVGNDRTEFLKKAKKFPQTGFFKKLNHLHNGYIQIAVETGLIGLSIFFLFIYALFKLPLQRDQFILMSTIIVIYLVGFIGEPLFFNRKPFLLFNLFIAIFIYHAHKKNIKKV